MPPRLLAVAVLGAVSLQAAAQAAAGCHADLLVLGIDFNALSEQEKLAAGAAVAQKVALETGMNSQNVLSKMFAGNYNANWSPVKNRPQANVFLASLLRQCTSPEMVLGALRGPQLQEAVTQALKDTLGNSRAKIGEISIIGASVVPVTSESQTQIAMAGASSAQQAGEVPSAAKSGGGGGIGGMFGTLLIFIVIGVTCALILPKIINKKGGGNNESDDESRGFTGH